MRLIKFFNIKKTHFIIKPLLIVSSVFLLFSSISCELSNDDYSYEINLVTIALDYSIYPGNELYGTLNDAKEIEKAIRLNCLKQEIPYSSYKYYQIGDSYTSDTSAGIYYPSKANILDALDNLAALSNNNSINIIYYSGHSFDNGSWLVARESASESFSALSVEEIYDKLKILNGKNLLISDSCFSGSFYKESAYSVENENLSFITAFNKFISTDSEVSNTYILCATEKDNTAHEPYYENREGMRIHGYFTKALLEGLGWCDGDKGILTEELIDTITDEDGIQGKLAETIPPAAQNNILSVDHLVEYIKANQDIALSEGEHQYPQVSGGRNDLVLFEY